MQRVSGLIVLLFFSVPGFSQNSIEVQGSFSGSLSDANVQAIYMDRISIWRISMTSTRDQQKKSSVRMNVNLFMSKNFNLSVGTFPIAFSYLNKKDSFGASFIFKKGDGRRTMFSHDTEGTVQITEVGKRVSGSFSYRCTDGKKDEEKAVTVTGTFSFTPPDGFAQ